MGRNAKTSLALGGAVAVLALFAAAPAWAATEHVYDPVLSLRGSTATSSEDEVPDPGPNHPPKAFEIPCGTITDSHGDVYVSSAGDVETKIGRVDVFNAEGKFLLEFKNEFQPCNLAVDSQGNLYVRELEPHKTSEFGTSVVDLYEPDSYPPSAATQYSLSKTFEFPKEGGSDFCNAPRAIAIDPSSDHLYIGHTCRVEEYGSAAEGSSLINGEIAIDQGAFNETRLGEFDIYGGNGDIYATTTFNPNNEAKEPSKVVVLDGSDGHAKCEAGGVELPGGEFEAFKFLLGAPIAVDQATGDFYVFDLEHKAIDQFAVEGEDCYFVGQLPQPPTLTATEPWDDLAVDSPCRTGPGLTEPCMGGEEYDSPNEGQVYITSGKTPASFHLFSFKPRIAGPPVVQAQMAVGVTETDALLEAELNPSGLHTTYHFEYTTQADFEENQYANATDVPIGEADGGAGGAFKLVSEPISELMAGVVYHFRLVATNCAAEGAAEEECLTLGEGNPGHGGEDASFSTYASPQSLASCSNAALRTGLSANLPDCRAYELVTPPDTGGHIPTMSMLGEGFGAIGFDTSMVSPDGGSLIFGSTSGALPRFGGGGFKDTYEALRGESGWQSTFNGLTGGQAEAPRPGGMSADHRYALWSVELSSKGTLADPSTGQALYLRVPPGIEPSPNCAVEAEPHGRFEWLGCGSLGVDPQAGGSWITPGGGHVIFESGNTAGISSVPVQLEPCAPPTGKRAIYDRTPGGPTRCVSVPPADASAEVKASFEERSARYRGTSADGTAVAFEVDGVFYVRVNNAETLAVVEREEKLKEEEIVDFGGISRDGSRVVYVLDGDIYVCDLGSVGCVGEGSNEPIRVGSGGESTLVNVSSDGSHIYFVSPKQLDGEEGEAGKDNLYVWDGGAVQFVTTLDAIDVDGDSTFRGLGLWTRSAVAASPIVSNGPADDPSRTTPEGKVLVFQSHTDLTGYASGGHSEIYRYEDEAAPGNRLRCISCNPTGAPAISNAELESKGPESVAQYFPPVNSLIHISNVTADGKKVFFQSGDRLVAGDLDGKVDVYEWEAEGVGGCERAAGCLALISSGKSVTDNYLYAMTPDAHDVFFLSGDSLVGEDPDKTPSIYDARVDGGFPPKPSVADGCGGEACQPSVSPPLDATPATSTHEGPGNLVPNRRSRGCPKGKRKVRRRGKTHCVRRRAGKRRSRHRHGHHNRGGIAR